MDKEFFLAELRRRLAYLPDSEIEKSLAFYAESIDDRMEDGMSEAEAVAALGDIDDIAREIETSLPLSTLVKGRMNQEKGSRSGLWTVLVILGSPVWLPLLLAAAAVILSVYIVIWAVIVTLFAALLSMLVSSACMLVYGFARLSQLGFYPALMVFGLALILTGFTILLFNPCKALVQVLLRSTGRFGRWLKLCFLKGGRNG